MITLEPLFLAANPVEGRRVLPVCQPANANVTLLVAAQGEKVGAWEECQRGEVCGVTQQRGHVVYLLVDHLRSPVRSVR